MEINFCEATTKVGTRIQKELGNQLQLEVQLDFDVEEKFAKVREVSVEEVKD